MATANASDTVSTCALACRLVLLEQAGLAAAAAEAEREPDEQAESDERAGDDEHVEERRGPPSGGLSRIRSSRAFLGAARRRSARSSGQRIVARRASSRVPPSAARRSASRRRASASCACRTARSSAVRFGFASCRFRSGRSARCVSAICVGEVVGGLLQVLDPEALAEDRAERGELDERRLHARGRHAEGQLRGADCPAQGAS